MAMVALGQLLREAPLAPFLQGDAETYPPAVEVTGVSQDSRRVHPGDLFVAVQGEHHDGKGFASQAVAQGAVAALGQGEAPLNLGVPWLPVDHDPRALLGPLAARVYGHPDRELTMVGITGTNGKSTLVALVAALLEAAGRPSGIVGTLGYRFRELAFAGERTTPEASDLFRMLRSMADAGAQGVAMEVSSHALALGRVAGAVFDAALFTNLSHDHLDFHGDLESYFEAKATLFTQLKGGGRGVINADDEYGRRLVERVPGAISYSIEGAEGASVEIRDLELTFSGIRGRVVTPRWEFPFESGLLGRFNASNLAAVAAVAHALELEQRALEQALAEAGPIPGRLDPVTLSGRAKGGEKQAEAPFVLVDYAHTPAALEAALHSVRELIPRTGATRGQVYLVFGCGGNRDTAKRPLMGRIAGDGAEVPILTSDNPRDEDPMEIIRQVEVGLKESGNQGYRVIPDRREAIRRAVAVARPGSVVLVAGKGHEAVQLVRGEVFPFSDREEVLAALEVRLGREARR